MFDVETGYGLVHRKYILPPPPTLKSQIGLKRGSVSYAGYEARGYYRKVIRRTAAAHRATFTLVTMTN
jgi:hypothetical protein